MNNAGIADRMSAPAGVSDTEWERVIRVNLTAPFLLTQAVLSHMPAAGAGQGAIVNTAAEAGLRGSAAGAANTASKHGVVGLTKSVAGRRSGAVVGVSARTVWRCFPSKERCVRLLFTAGIDMLAARLREWRPGHPLERISAREFATDLRVVAGPDPPPSGEWCR